MHIECLEYFLKIAKVKSISKVADSCHMSQSAMSQQMQKLEDSLGFKLLVRSNRGVELTEGGQIVLKYTNNIIRTYNKMMEELNNQGKKMRTIKIEAAWTIATYCLPCGLYLMKKKYPLHSYELVSSPPEKIEQDVINDICEVGFTSSLPIDNTLATYEVNNEEVVLVSTPNYSIPEMIELEEILEYPLIMLKEKCIIKENLANQLQEIGISFNDLNTVLELESTEAIKTLVMRGFGVAFLPYSAIKKEIYNGQLTMIKVKDLNIDYCIYLINKNNDLSNPVQEFVVGFKKLGKKVCC